MGLVSQNKIMGKSKSPTFFSGESGIQTPAKSSNAPYLILLVVIGTGGLWYLRSHASNTAGKTTPALTVSPANTPDQAQIDNLTQALQALAKGNPSTPAGGTSTPIAKVN